MDRVIAPYRKPVAIASDYYYVLTWICELDTRSISYRASVRRMDGIAVYVTRHPATTADTAYNAYIVHAPAYAVNRADDRF
jgi:hypothetical protein